MARTLLARVGLVALAMAAAPAGAARWMAAGNQGRDLLVATAEGDLLAFAEPGKLLRRRPFGAGLLALDLAPNAPLAAVLCRLPEKTTLSLWNYRDDAIREAPAEVADDALSVAFARGGHALFVLDGRSKVLVVGVADLAVKREIPTAPVADQPGGLQMAVSPRDWFVAFGSQAGLQLGRTDAAALEAMGVQAARASAPQLAFTPDAATLVVGGDAGMFLVPTGDGPVRQLPLLDATPSSAFALGSDGQFAYLADGAKLHAVRLSTGLVHLTGTVRAGEAQPRAAAVLTAWGAVAVAYDDGQIAWYRPLARELVAQYPQPLSTALPEVPTPAAAAAACSAVEALFSEVQLFVSPQAVAPAVLDEQFERLGDLEQLAKQHGWQALVLAMVASAAGLPERIPAPFTQTRSRLAVVDRVELPGVTLVPELLPVGLERRLGPREETSILRQLPDGRTLPLFRIGPFLIPIDGERFPDAAPVSLTAASVRAYLRAAAESGRPGL